MKNKIFLVFTILLVSLTACQNQDWEFDDFEYQSVYFAYQYPVRTITLGEDVFDTSLDNEYKCKIYATLAGVYDNDKDVTIDFSVADPLTTGLLFGEGGSQINAMPSNYYSLLSDKIKIPKGELKGAIDVQLTDDFFADPLAIKNTYVIPIQMNNVVNADTILSGEALFPGAKRGLDAEWSKVPKDFIFYAVKYINKWHGNYLRRGIDVVTKDGNKVTEERNEEYVEYDEVVKLNTTSLSELIYPIDYKTKYGVNLNFKTDILFDQDNKCTLKERETSYQLNDSTSVYNISVSGTGAFVKDGEKKSWGNKDRDAMYLDYIVNYEIKTSFPVSGAADDIQVVKYETNDTLVMRDRAVSFETFIPVSQ